MENFVDLDRRFRDLTDKELEDPSLLAIWGYSEAISGTTWSELLKSERIVLLAEAGSGKTREMQHQVARLRKEGRVAFFIPIEALEKEDVRGYLAMEAGEIERLDAWAALEGEPAWFFLDSVDELKLVNGKLEFALGKLSRELGTKRNRTRIIVSCRPTDWRPVQDMEIFKTKFPESEPEREYADSDAEFIAPFREKPQKTNQRADQPAKKSRCVVLLPLGESQIERFATENGVADAKALVAEIRRREAWTFARRPLDLGGLIATWNALGNLGSLRRQHEIDIENSLRDRPDRADHNVLTHEKAHDGAARLALALLLAKRRTIRAPEQAIGDPIEAASLDAASILTDWTDAQVAALLRRPLFDPATYGRVRFHHRSIQEFLAAEQLQKLRACGMTKRQLRSLLLAETYGERVVIPSMRPIAAWLSYANSDVAREVLSREPEVLVLHGDPETLTQDVRIALVRSYVAAYRDGGWRGLRNPITEVRRLANPDLSQEIRRAWREPRQNEEITEFLLKLIWLGAVQDCADIAFEALMDAALGPYSRATAAHALAECGRTDLLRSVADDLFAHPQRWPDRIVYSVADAIFPKVISIDELEKLLLKTREPSRTVGGFSWTLFTIAEGLEPGSDAAVTLRSLLAKLVLEHRNRESEWYQAHSRFTYLTGALGKLCARQLVRKTALNTELVKAGVIASFFHGDTVVGRDDIDCVRREIAATPALRAQAFWLELELVLSIKHHEGRHLLFEVLHDGLLGGLLTDDWNWLFAELRRPRNSVFRDTAFYALVDLWYARGKLKSDRNKLARAVKNNPELNQVVAALTKKPAPNPQMEQLEKDQEAHREKREAERQRVEKSWADWKAKADADPSACFSVERADESMWTLLNWLRQSDDARSHLAFENWRRIRAILGDVIADGFERTLRAYWRKTEPRIWSRKKPSERNTIWNSQSAALTGLLIEANVGPDWAKSLSASEARRAAEWGLTDLNGAPEWLDALAEANPDAVRDALITELEAELKHLRELPHPHTLNLLSYGSDKLRQLVTPYLKSRILTWPTLPRDGQQAENYATNLDTMLSILAKAGACDSEIAQQCEGRLLAKPGHPSARVWLQGLCACDLRRGFATMKGALSRMSAKNRSKYTPEWFVAIFGDRDYSRVPLSTSADADLLLDMTQWAYRYATQLTSENDDNSDDDDDASVTTREGEVARSRILNTLIGLPGADAYRALGALSVEPLFSHMTSRLEALARERAADDSEPAPLAPSDYRELERRYEAPPRTRDALFEVMLDRLDDIEHDIRDHDFGDRNVLATITDEKKMQPLLAKKFENDARGHYQVAREEEVADRKKTDIRLLAFHESLKAVCEVKIGDNWNIGELEDALRNQLVGQYMRHEDCTAGCLLVTYAGRNQFFMSRKPVAFEEVVAHLRGLAADIEAAEKGRIRLAVRSLDLRATQAVRR